MGTLVTLTDRQSVSLTNPETIYMSRFRLLAVHGALSFTDNESPGTVTFNGTSLPLPDSRVAEHRDTVAWLNANLGSRFDFNEASNRYTYVNRGVTPVTLLSPALGWTTEVTVAPEELVVAPSAHTLNILTTLLVYSSCGSSLQADPVSGRLVRSDLVGVIPVTAEDRRVGRFHYEARTSVEHVLCGQACERLTNLDMRLYTPQGKRVSFAEPVTASFEVTLLF